MLMGTEAMADNRALMAAFQKVRVDVDQALEQTRRKEEAARAAEEAKRMAERRAKRAGVELSKSSKGTSTLDARKSTAKKPAEPPKSAPVKTAPKAPAAPAPRTYTPTGAFGAVLAGAAKASGAVFREAPALISYII